jgi:hypothetical protein
MFKDKLNEAVTIESLCLLIISEDQGSAGHCIVQDFQQCLYFNKPSKRKWPSLPKTERSMFLHPLVRSVTWFLKC